MSDNDTSRCYLTSLVELADAEERYARHEITGEALEVARAGADVALAALEKDWAIKDAQEQKQEKKR